MKKKLIVLEVWMRNDADDQRIRNAINTALHCLHDGNEDYLAWTFKNKESLLKKKKNIKALESLKINGGTLSEMEKELILRSMRGEITEQEFTDTALILAEQRSRA